MDLSQAEYEIYGQDFAEFDKNGTSELEMPEIKELMRKQMGVEPDDKTMQEFMAEVDKDADGTVSLNEYISAVAGNGWTVNGKDLTAEEGPTVAATEPEEEAVDVALATFGGDDVAEAGADDPAPEIDQGVSVEVTQEPAEEPAVEPEEPAAAVEEDAPVGEAEGAGEAAGEETGGD